MSSKSDYSVEEDHKTDAFSPSGKNAVSASESPRKTVTASNRILQIIESLDQYSTVFGDVYQRVAYKRLVQRELELLDPNTDAQILHVGCGPLPMTAMVLAKEGYSVTAIDHDPAAVEAAQAAVDSRNLDKKIEIYHANGEGVEPSDFDVVWLSFHVYPKAKIVQQLVTDLQAHQSLVYRRPRGWSEHLYPTESVPDHIHQDSVSHRFGKESVIVCSEPQACESCVDVPDCPARGADVTERNSIHQDTRTLASFAEGEQVVIRSAPDNDQLPALGIRSGKEVEIQNHQPFNGPVVVSTGGRTVAIDRDIAQEIHVQQLATVRRASEL